MWLEHAAYPVSAAGMKQRQQLSVPSRVPFQLCMDPRILISFLCSLVVGNWAAITDWHPPHC